MSAGTINEETLGKIVQFVFMQKMKSDLGWDFLAVVETGREKDYAHKDLPFCHALVLDGTRSSWTGSLVQDDRVVSAARIAALDERDWAVSGGPVIVRGRDPLVKMDAESF